MKRYIVCIFLFTGVFYSCKNTNGKEDLLGSNEILKTVVKPFSDSLKADTFKIKLAGSEPENMQLTFTIHSFKNIQIYNINIKATDLFKNYDATIDLSKKKNQLTFLKNEIDSFLDDGNFMEPAITDQERPDQNVPDRSFYQELKKSQLNGFAYRLGKTNKIYIGWSGKENKVKSYYSCCK